MTAKRPWSLQRVAAGISRRVPLRPFRVFFPYGIWRRLFWLWLATIRAQPDRSKAMRELLAVYADAFAAMDRGAIEYEGGVHPKHRLTRYHDFFVERIRPGERVLDVGCHKGELAFDLAERSGATVIGLDVSPWALADARKRFSHPRVTYVQADVLGYRPEEPVDVVVLSNVLEHLGPRVGFLRALHEKAGAERLLVRVPAVDRDWVVPLRRDLGLSSFSDPSTRSSTRASSFVGSSRPQGGRCATRSSPGARSGSRLACKRTLRTSPAREVVEERRVTVEPGLEREPLDCP